MAEDRVKARQLRFNPYKSASARSTSYVGDEDSIVGAIGHDRIPGYSTHISCRTIAQVVNGGVFAGRDAVYKPDRVGVFLEGWS